MANVKTTCFAFQKVCMLPCNHVHVWWQYVVRTIKLTLQLWLYKRLFPEIGDKYAEWQQKNSNIPDSKDIGNPEKRELRLKNESLGNF